MARRPMSRKRFLMTVVVFVVVGLYRFYTGNNTRATNQSSSSARTPGGSSGYSSEIARAAAGHLSKISVETEGLVKRTLPDDTEGSRHQRFILTLPDGMTVLVAHNIDLAPRVPLSTGDRVTIHGQYEWNDRGGVLHWTHRDPGHRHEGGWIEFQGKRYQ